MDMTLSRNKLHVARVLLQLINCFLVFPCRVYFGCTWRLPASLEVLKLNNNHMMSEIICFRGQA